MTKENICNERVNESDVTVLLNNVANQPSWVKQYFVYYLSQSSNYSSKSDIPSMILIQCYKPHPDSNFYALQKTGLSHLC